jgi:small-conductance mechanosensitive channel
MPSLLNLLIALGIIIISLIAGFMFEKIILASLYRFAERTRWRMDEIIISSLKRVFILWFLLAGIYLAFYVALNEGFFAKIFPIIEKLIIAIGILSATIVSTKIAVKYVSDYTIKTAKILPSTSIFVNLTKLVIIMLGALIMLQTLGISITPLITAMGIGGLAVALALQDTLSNLFAGLHIILTKQVKPGDYIKLDSGEEGFVLDITWRNTVIRALPNNLIIVPNSKLANAIITNYFLPEPEMSVIVQVGVSYDSDLEKVEKVTIDVAKEVLREVPGGVSNFEPFIRYHTFGDSSINFSVILRAKGYVDQYLVRHEFIKKLHKRYQQEGINIPFPIRTVYIKNEENSGWQNTYKPAGQ